MPIITTHAYSWAHTFWKGLRPALFTAAGAAVAAAIGTVTPQTFIDLGIPAALAVFICEAARNWLKQHGYLGKV